MKTDHLRFRFLLDKEGRVVIARVRRNRTYCRGCNRVDHRNVLRTEYSAADIRLKRLQ
jgi:hypothetical protein